MFRCYIYISSCLIFFFNQKTAYEMRISDLSSYVCSSDLYSDLNTAIPNTPFTLKGHVGYTDGSMAPWSGAQSGNYWDWSVGAEASYKILTFGVSYVDTDVRNSIANDVGSDSGLVFSVGASLDRKSTRLNSSH